MRDRIKVLIVDDSLIFRSALERALKEEDDIQVVGSVRNGLKAVEFIKQAGEPPDVITLDLEMPEMDGLATLRAIEELNLAKAVPARIGSIMVSAHTFRGADSTIRALELGAFDFVTKPDGKDFEKNAELFRRGLTVKIRQFALQRKKLDQPDGCATAVAAPPPAARPAPPCHGVDAIVIGVSTGGPKALAGMLPELSKVAPLPVFIVQHMPPLFTTSLAGSLDSKCGHTVIEAKDGDRVAADHIYIAPGGRHLAIQRREGGAVYTMLNDQAPENGCKPSVDILFRSAAAAYGGRVIAIVLTGMGCDGAKGLAPLKRAGAFVLAQDEASSVVWGMPGSAVATGTVDEVQPLDRIPAAVKNVLLGRRSREN